MKRTAVYPFTAIVGQEEMKLSLILNVINPALGGVLIKGEKGTAKSTALLLSCCRRWRLCTAAASTVTRTAASCAMTVLLSCRQRAPCRRKPSTCAWLSCL